MKAWRLVCVTLLLTMALVGCDNPAGGGGTGVPSKGKSPVLTDIKMAADFTYFLTGPYITTLTNGATYYVLLFVSDQDKDITKIVVDFSKNGELVETKEFSVTEQQTAEDGYYFEVIFSADGTWKLDAYVEDAKGNKSTKKSITVTVATL